MVKRPTVALDLDAVFAALSHPIRRAMLEQLAGGDATVGELARPHGVSLPAISRHLRVLERAGLLKEEPDGRVRRCQIEAAPLSAAFGWLTRYRVLWEDRFARLAEHLEETRKNTRKEELKHARKKQA
jgi:DNA-binding transcriptional ArsR family regulator